MYRPILHNHRSEKIFEKGHKFKRSAILNEQDEASSNNVATIITKECDTKKINQIKIDQN